MIDSFTLLKQHSAKLEFLSGIQAELPLILGVFPFGLIYGVLASSAGLPPSIGQVMSSVVFAGSAQFITVQLINQAAPYGVIILTAIIVNLRHALYSASIAPYVQHLSFRWKILLSYLLTDEAYAVAINHYDSVPGVPDPTNDKRHWYFLGAGLTLWTFWQISSAIGIFIGAQIPAGWALDFTLSLTFIAIVFPNFKDLASFAAAIAGGTMAVVFAGLPLKLGLVIASVIGIAVGLWMEGK